MFIALELIIVKQMGESSRGFPVVAFAAEVQQLAK
jgi:hypothetical protein